ncbi:MAG: M20/M25/M40 family metallo-hydrolase, partial [Anaerolineae bacterium]
FTLVALPVLETRFLVPTITALISRPAQNLVVQFAAPHPKREVVLCAHVDSKTELLDHAARDRLLRWGRPAMILALGCGALVVVESQLPHGAVRAIIHAAAVGMALPAVAYGLGMGANLAGGRMRRRPSRGAVDNGAAVAVLLDLARRLQRGDPALKHTAVTLLLTVGEEVQMQGALAYVDDRTAWPLPTCVVNLDSVGQDGGYLLYAEDGTVMYRLPADPGIVGALGTAVEAVNGTQPPVAPSTNTDAFAFLRRGIPAATLGSFDAELGKRGLHGPLDNPDRVDRQRLVETVGILSRFLVDVDTSPVDA